MENSNSKINYDFNKTCRTCLSQENTLVSIFSNETAADTPYSEMIMTFSPFEITETDELPHLICSKCADFTNIAYKFKTELENSEKILREYLIQRKEEILMESLENEEQVIDNYDFNSDVPEEEKNYDFHKELRIIHEKAFKNESKPIAQRVLCTICNKTFTPLSIRKHKLLHKKKLMRKIEKEVEDNETKQIESLVKCTLCDYVFTSKITLKRHISARHTKMEAKNIANGIFPNLNCNMCGKRFITEDILIEHINCHNETICPFCKRLCPSKSALQVHVRIHTGEKPYLCNICGKGFTQQANLAKHLRKHANLTPFACELCEKRFTSESSLKAHIARHSIEKPQYCQKCGRTLSKTDDLATHVCLESEIKPLECKVCHKRFKAHGHITDHMRSHTKEKPYVCHICGLAFGYAGSIKKHVQTHEGEKQFMCYICGKQFAQNSTMKLHLKSHENESETDLKNEETIEIF